MCRLGCFSDDLQSSDHHWPGRRPSQAALAATRLWGLRVAALVPMKAATMGFQRALDLWVWGFLGFRLKPESALNGFVE